MQEIILLGIVSLAGCIAAYFCGRRDGYEYAIIDERDREEE